MKTRTTTISIVLKDGNHDRPIFSVKSSRCLSQKEIEEELQEGYIGLDASKCATIIDGRYV